MFKTKFAQLGVIACLAVAGAALAVAQDGPGQPAAPPGGAGGGGGFGRGGPGGGPGGPPNGDFRQMMANMMKQQLGVNDEEWAIIQPRLEKVQTLQMQSRAGGMMGMMRMGGPGGRGPGGGGAGAGGPGGGGPGGAGGPFADLAQSEVAKASQALRAVLENQDAKPEEIKAKLAAVREAREKTKEELKKAQAALAEVITLRQEAVLVNMGTLD